MKFKKFSNQYITSYHIDSWQGLKIFADKARELTGEVAYRPDIIKRLKNID